MSIVWRLIPDAGGMYEVSSDGKVRSHHRYQGRPLGYVLKQSKTKFGHLRVAVYYSNGRKVRLVHQLVAEAFLGPRPDGADIRHLDGNPRNNCVENLRYGTRTENLIDSVEQKTHFHTKKTHCPYGHPLSGANLRIRAGENGRSRRDCRTCVRIQDRERARRYRAMRIARHDREFNAAHPEAA